MFDCRSQDLVTDLHGLDVVTEVEVGISKLGVDGGEGAEVICAALGEWPGSDCEIKTEFHPQIAQLDSNQYKIQSSWD